MTTINALTTEVMNDLDRPDLDAEIRAEVRKAIRHYQATRFWFNESRSETFPTVAGQDVYSSADDASIPLFYKIDGAYITIGTEDYELKVYQPDEWEADQGVSAQSRPIYYARFSDGIQLYPKPDAVYSIRIVGHLKVAEPDLDADTGNTWLDDAYELLRGRTCGRVSLIKSQDFELASMWRGIEAEELNTLKSTTSKKTAVGSIQPTQF